jgi:dihydrofolate reductase
MIISMIAAMAENRVIGKDNDMPWGMSMPADLQHFKKVTMGKPVIMGRKTFDSIGRPLPGRLNIVISRDTQYSAEGITVVDSPDKALELASKHEEVMIIGGGKIYEHFLPQAQRLYLTEIELNVKDFDTQFPDYTVFKWQQSESEYHQADEKNSYNYRFVTLVRQS